MTKSHAVPTIVYETPDGVETEDVGEDRGLDYDSSLEAWTITYEEADEEAMNDHRTQIIPHHRVYEVDTAYSSDRFMR